MKRWLNGNTYRCSLESELEIEGENPSSNCTTNPQAFSILTQLVTQAALFAVGFYFFFVTMLIAA